MGSQKQDVSSDFICEWFDFLRTWIPINEEDDGYDEENYGDDLTNEQSTITVSSFNCDAHYLIFATNIGSIYCFSRGERQARGPLFNFHPVKSAIIKIEILDDTYLALLMEASFVIYNFKQDEIIYSWSLPRSPDAFDPPRLATFRAIVDTSRHRYCIFTGDSVGRVRCHNIDENEDETVFTEEETCTSDDHRHHEIVQIDIYNAELIVVSSCFRSVILWKSISDIWTTIPIGRNVRKVCGNYGAVFHTDGNIVLAARPSLHLIKANTTDGCVFETFKLKHAKPTRTLNLFNESSDVNQLPSSSINLGSLMNVRINGEDFIASWSPHALFIIKLDGTLLVKEYSTKKIINASVSYSHGYTDVIVLREDRCIFRIRFTANNGIKSKLMENGLGQIITGSLSSQNLLNLPSQAFSSLEGELKKIYSIVQDKFTVSGETLFPYSSLEDISRFNQNLWFQRESNLDNRDRESIRTDSSDPNTKNDFPDDISDSPLYLHEKVFRKNAKNASNEDLPCEDNQLDDDRFDYSRSSTSSSLSIRPASSIEDSPNNNNAPTPPVTCNEDPPKILDTMDLRGVELVKVFNKSNRDDEENGQKQAKDPLSDLVQESNSTSGSTSLESSVSSRHTMEAILNEMLRPAEETMRIEPEEIYSNQQPEEEGILRLDWHPAIENTHHSGRMIINYICASSFSDQTKDSYVWLSCFIKGRPKLIYYPDFEAMKLPATQCKMPKIGSIRKKVLLLYEDGDLWSREDMDESSLSLGALGSKWNKLSTPRFSSTLTSLSLCSKDSIGWFCDSSGDAWLLKLNTTSWTKISHDPENRFSIKDIFVCPSDSSMVWCIDQSYNLHVRVGIFNMKSDRDELIGGVTWLNVKAPVKVASIAITTNSVWILSKDTNQIFKRLGIQPPSSYVGSGWQEIRPPTLVKDSLAMISASISGDIWLLSKLGFVWQHCDSGTSTDTSLPDTFC